MSANISIISLFCKQMREKRSPSADLSSRKNEENEASPPTPPRRGRGVKCLEDRVQIEYNWRTYHSPLLGEPRVAVRWVNSTRKANGWGWGFSLFSFLLFEAGGETSFLFIFFFIFNTFLYDQIEMKMRFLRLCEAISWLRCPCFCHLAL